MAKAETRKRRIQQKNIIEKFEKKIIFFSKTLVKQRLERKA